MREDGAVIRVVVADDHPLFRDALTRTIDASGLLSVVGEASDACEATELIERVRPDVAVIDRKMPGDGLAVLAAVTSQELDTRVLFLSEYVDSFSVLSAVSAGACGYLAKGMDAENIRAAILEVAAGGTALSTEARQALVSGVKSDARGAVSALTARELQMLELVAEGLSNADIAARLFVSPETVKAHLRNLFGKLGVSDRTAAAALALRRGLIE